MEDDFEKWRDEKEDRDDFYKFCLERNEGRSVLAMVLEGMWKHYKLDERVKELENQ